MKTYWPNIGLLLIFLRVRRAVKKAQIPPVIARIASQ
jgi:hypothetical protein